MNGITDSMDMNLSELWETVEDRGAWYAPVHGVPKSQTQQQPNNNNGVHDKFEKENCKVECGFLD